jgi:hypothetical protein
MVWHPVQPVSFPQLLTSVFGGVSSGQYISETGRYICVNSKFISTDGEVRKYSSANFCPANRGDVTKTIYFGVIELWGRPGLAFGIKRFAASLAPLLIPSVNSSQCNAQLLGKLSASSYLLQQLPRSESTLKMAFPTVPNFFAEYSWHIHQSTLLS